MRMGFALAYTGRGWEAKSSYSHGALHRVDNREDSLPFKQQRNVAEAEPQNNVEDKLGRNDWSIRSQ